MEEVIRLINGVISSSKDGDIKSVIGKFILNNVDFIKENNVAGVAKKCNVSPSTIIRFCQELNISGFNELKYIFKKNNDFIDVNQNQNSFSDKYLKIKNDATNYINSNFTNLAQDLTPYMQKNRNIYIFCFNIAYFATKPFIQRMRKNNYNIFLEGDLSAIQSYIDNVKEEDLVIFISLSGTNKIIESFAKILKGKSHTFAILGKDEGFSKHVDHFCILKNNEIDFWDLFSIRSQSLQQFWDYLFISLIKTN